MLQKRTNTTTETTTFTAREAQTLMDCLVQYERKVAMGHQPTKGNKMTPVEQTAFVNAYAKNVGIVRTEDVAETVRRHYAGEDIECRDYNSILDALGMWHEAVMYALITTINAR